MQEMPYWLRIIFGAYFAIIGIVYLVNQTKINRSKTIDGKKYLKIR